MPLYTCTSCKKSFDSKLENVKLIRCPHCSVFFKPAAPTSPTTTPIQGEATTVTAPPTDVFPQVTPPPPAQVKPVLTLTTPVSPAPTSETPAQKVTRIAATKLTSTTYFSWCPPEYVDAWIDAATKGTILAQGSKKLPFPPQGPGLYCASSPMNSQTWARATSLCMVITLVNVPTIDKNDAVQMEALKAGGAPNSISDLFDLRPPGTFLLIYGGVGGFARLTANTGVTIGKQLGALGVPALKSLRAKLSGGSDAAKAFDAQLKGENIDLTKA